MSIKEARQGGADSRNMKWVPHIIVGIALLLVGMFIVLNSSLALEIVYRASALGLLVIGMFLMVNGLGTERGKKVGRANVLAGLAAAVLSFAISLVPDIAFWLLLLAVAVWTMGSGIFLVFGRGDKLQFSTGSIAPIIIGVVSLALAMMILVNPFSGLKAVVTLAGLLVVFIGASQLAVGVIHGRFLTVASGIRK